MSLTSLRRDAMRVKLTAGIDLDFIDYESAITRHLRRLDNLIADKIAPELDRKISSRSSSDPSNFNTKAAKMELLNKADTAKKLLGDDTPELWKKDQATIEAYKSRLGAPTSSPPPFGGTPNEMFGHYLRYEKANIKNTFDEGW
jgi:hypothetical protein